MERYKFIVRVLSVVSMVVSGCFMLSWLVDGMVFMETATPDKNPFNFWLCFFWCIKTMMIVGWIACSVFLFEWSNKK